MFDSGAGALVHYAGVYGTSIVTAASAEEAQVVLEKKYPYLHEKQKALLTELKEGEAIFFNGPANIFDYYDIGSEREFGPYHDRKPRARIALLEH